jgi:hypothetical protein
MSHPQAGPAGRATYGEPRGVPGDLAARLDALEARQQIADVVNLVARGWDRRDEDLLRKCFWPDARLRHGGFDGAAADFVAFGLEKTARVLRARHLISNLVIAVQRDRALAECHFCATHRRPNAAGSDEEDYEIGGRFLDRFERRAGDWRIAFRRGLNEFERLSPRADVSLACADPASLGRRWPEDALYAMLADLGAGT